MKDVNSSQETTGSTESKEKKIGFWESVSRFFKDPVTETTDAVEKMAEKALDTVEDTVNAVGDTVNAVGNMAGKVVLSTTDLIGQGIGMISNSVINTTKFMTNAKYRQEEVYPWVQEVLKDSWGKVSQEIDESQEMMMILWKYSHGHDLTEEEEKAAKEQLFDIMKTVPALAIFALPGGAILLPLLARALPWNLMPSSFKEQVKEEYGEDSLKESLSPDEEIRVDESVVIPEEVQKEVVSNIQEVIDEKISEDTP